MIASWSWSGRAGTSSTSPSCRRWPTELGIAEDVVWVGGVPLEETVHFYRCADVFVYPSFNETFGLPILEAMASGCPVVTSDTSAMPETAGGCALLADPDDPESIRRRHRQGLRAGRGTAACRGSGAGRRVHLGRHGRADARGVPRGLCQARRTWSTYDEDPGHRRSRLHRLAHHDRLVELGHDVVVLDALTAPVHRDGKPNYLTPGAELYVGDVRNRDLLANLLRRVDAVYHFAAYQDYLPDFARFTDVNVTSTALIYEIAVAERLDLSRIVVASSQSAMGEGLYRCAEHGEQTPGHPAGSRARAPASGT